MDQMFKSLLNEHVPHPLFIIAVADISCLSFHIQYSVKEQRDTHQCVQRSRVMLSIFFDLGKLYFCIVVTIYVSQSTIRRLYFTFVNR